MPTRKPLIIPIAVMLIWTTVGCEDNENKRLAEMAERQLNRQAEQNRRMSDLQQEVAEGSRRLVEADAESRKDMVAWQQEIQAERTEVGRQRDDLEEERRALAVKRRMDPIIATAIANIGLLLACLLPLVLCWYLLHRKVETSDDQAVAEVLIEELVSERPILLAPPRDLPTKGNRPPALPPFDVPDGEPDQNAAAAGSIDPFAAISSNKGNMTMTEQIENAHDLLADELAAEIPKLYETEAVNDPIVRLKWFTPDSSWTWYVLEYDPDDRICFGLVDGLERELGYFSLTEIEQVRGPLGLAVERDLYWKPKPLSQCK